MKFSRNYYSLNKFLVFFSSVSSMLETAFPSSLLFYLISLYIRSRYIGTHTETTKNLEKLIKKTVKNNWAVVATLHSHKNSINYYD